MRADRLVAILLLLQTRGQVTAAQVADGFDMAEAWRLITDEVDQRRAPLRARAMVAPHLVGLCRSVFGNRVRIGPAGTDGRVTVELRGHSEVALAGEVAGFGAELEIIDPPEVRERLARIGVSLAELYGDRSSISGRRGRRADVR